MGNKSRKGARAAAGGDKLTLLVSAPTTHVTVTQTLDGGARLTAHLNGKTLGFSQDIAHAVVGQVQTNTLDWIVVGPPGSSYSIAVTSPPGKACTGGSQLDAAGRDAGSCDFDT